MGAIPQQNDEGSPMTSCASTKKCSTVCPAFTEGAKCMSLDDLIYTLTCRDKRQEQGEVRDLRVALL